MLFGQHAVDSQASEESRTPIMNDAYRSMSLMGAVIHSAEVVPGGQAIADRDIVSRYSMRSVCVSYFLIVPASEMIRPLLLSS